MKGMSLPKMSTDRSPRRMSVGGTAAACADKLRQQFMQSEPNRVWVSDITYIRAGGRWHYLCVVIDLFSRKVIAWKVSPKMDAALVIDTFKKAFTARKMPSELIFHSDQGSQYTSAAFKHLLDDLNVTQSFSRPGTPCDNAVCESFFKHLKREEAARRRYENISDLRISMFEYIEGFYNAKRPHGTLDHLTPNEKEELFGLCQNEDAV